MAKIQIKSETRKDLSFFPSSFDNYIPKDDKVRMLDSIVRSMDSKLIIALKQYRLYHSNDTASLAWLQVSLFTWLAIPV